jgi:excisionase family DNA binding protein
MQTDQIRTLVTVAEACRELTVSRGTIYKLLEAGQLKSVKIGGCRRIPWSEIERVQEHGTD